jgi:hypothetical protein
VVVEGQPNLFEFVRTGAPPGGLACTLHRRQEQADERANDGNDDEQFDKCETTLDDNAIWTGSHETPLQNKTDKR